jgi:hypothetical protein
MGPSESVACSPAIDPSRLEQRDRTLVIVTIFMNYGVRQAGKRDSTQAVETSFATVEQLQAHDEVR